MSCPDPLYDYDDYNDFYGESLDYEDYNDDVEEEVDADWREIRDAHDGTAEYRDDLDPDELDDAWNDDYDDSMDGDFDSAMRDAGWGTDEDYGYYGEDF